MNENEKTMTREEIIKKAQSDKDFKKALLDNPKETLGQLGVQVPENVEVKVVEESAKVVYLVLPVNPDELTDEQLDVVAGAGWYNPPACSQWGCPTYGPGGCMPFTPPKCSPWYCDQYSYC